MARGRVGADGKGSGVEGEYLEPIRRTSSCNVEADWEPGTATTVTYRLEAIEGGTRVTLHHKASRHVNRARATPTGGRWSLAGSRVTPHRNRRAPSFDPPASTPPHVPRGHERGRETGDGRARWLLEKALGPGRRVCFRAGRDPKGVWGVGIIEVEGEAAVKVLEKGSRDPVGARVSL